MDRFSVCKAIVSSFYLARRQRIPEDKELNNETMIAQKDWENIETEDLLICAERARKAPKLGPVTNRDVILENEKLIAWRGQKQRRIENRQLIEGPGGALMKPDEMQEFSKRWRKILNQ